MGKSFKIIYNLEGLSDADVAVYSRQVSEYFDLDPDMNWFDVLWMTDPDTGLRRRQLYARRGTTDVLRDKRKISVTEMAQHDGPSYVSFTAKGQDATGRTEIAVGTHSTEGLKGEKLAAAVSTAETRAGRRLTLKFCGLGILDYTEVSDPVEAKGTPTDLAPVGPAPIFAPTAYIAPPLPQYQAQASANPPVTAVGTDGRADDSAVAEGLAEAEAIGRLALEAAGLAPAEPPAAPKQRRTRKKNTVDLSLPSQNETVSNLQIDEQVPMTQLQPPVCLDCHRPLSEHVLINSVRTCPKPVLAPVAEVIAAAVPAPAVTVGLPSPATLTVPPLTAPIVITTPAPTPKKWGYDERGVWVEGGQYPEPIKSSTPAPPPPAAPHQPILAPSAPAPTTFPGQPTAEQQVQYRERLREYSNVILPGAGMVPSAGFGGPSAKLRIYAERMAGKTTQQMTTDDWDEFFEGMKSFADRNGAKGLVKYINDVIGAK